MSFKKLKSLLFKTARIQEEIDRENSRKAPDTFRLLRLKKIRLAIKDQILRLTTPAPALRPARASVRASGRPRTA